VSFEEPHLFTTPREGGGEDEEEDKIVVFVPIIIIIAIIISSLLLLCVLSLLLIQSVSKSELWCTCFKEFLIQVAPISPPHKK
jgi:hypothetical protein